MINDCQDIQLFFNPELGKVRVILRDNAPWFIAKDVCECVGIVNSRDATHRLDEDEKCLESSDTIGGIHDVTLISESGLYKLLIRSKKPAAKLFSKWITSEVLPSIRVCAVSSPDSYLKKIVDDPEWAISLLKQIKSERDQKNIAISHMNNAIQEKSRITSNREAECMSRLKHFKRENKRLTIENEYLRSRLGDSKNYKSVKSISWLHDFFFLSNSKRRNGVYAQVGMQLKHICAQYGFKSIPIPDSNYGEVHAYDVRAIDIFKQLLSYNPDFMKKYRRDFS